MNKETWQHYIGTRDIDSDIITQDRFDRWNGDDFICIFCGNPITNYDYMYCHRCSDYKGVTPDCPK